jgi:two-component system cell cycle sensor histidine kinase/response regulator CckA
MAEELGWLHITADIAIFLAYAAILLVIATFVRKRSDLGYPHLYWLFGAFLLSSGLDHLLEASLFWHPWPHLTGLVKVVTALVTALVSWALVVALVRVPGTASRGEQLRDEIADRKRVEEEVLRLNSQLRDRVGELETLLDVLPVAIGIATDTTGQNIRTNKAFAHMLRLSPDSNASLSAPEPEAPTHFEVFHQGVKMTPEQLPLQVTAREGMSLRAFEEEILLEGGERLMIEAYTAPLYDGDVVRGAVGAFVDVTARRRAEEERAQVERRLQETQKLQSLEVLAGGIAHDFNNLLTGILGNASLAKMELPDSSPIHEYLEQIQQGSTRAADLCRQMLAYAGKGRFVVTRLDLSELVRETTWLLQSSIDRNTRLSFELASGLPPISGDATQIRQVVMNLVINASESLQNQRGTVSVSTGVVLATEAYLRQTVIGAELAEGEYVYVEVSDTGCGMDAEVLARIFDPFFSTKFTGRGLGLAAVLGIVRGHHGALRVYSEPGRGTVFKVLWPSAGGPVDARPASDRPLGWRGWGTVLVVDDQEVVRTTAQRMLEVMGFQVVTATDGAEGLACFDEHRSDIVLVLLDLTMPLMDGPETFEALRQRDRRVRVLLMSGFNEQEAVHGFLGKGLAGFLQKPFSFEDLSDRLGSLLEERTIP